MHLPVRWKEMIPRGVPLPQCNKEMSLGKGEERVPLWRKTFPNTHLLLFHRSLSAGQGNSLWVVEVQPGAGERGVAHFHTHTGTYNNSDTCPAIGVCDSGWAKTKEGGPAPQPPLLSKSLPTSQEDFPIASVRYSYHNSTHSLDGLFAFQKYCETHCEITHRDWNRVSKRLIETTEPKLTSTTTQNHSGCLFTSGKLRHWAQLKSTCHCISTEFCGSAAGLLKARRQIWSYFKTWSLEISKLTSKSSSWWGEIWMYLDLHLFIGIQ